MGVCYLILKKFKNSNICFESALNIKPNFVEALIGKSRIEFNNKNYKNSIVIYNKIIKINPNNDKFYFKKSICLQKIGNFEEALKNLDKALTISQNIDYLYEKGKILYKLDRMDEAIIFIDKIFKIYNKTNENNNINNNIIEECHLLKGQILLKKGNNFQAKNEFDEVIKINPNNSKAFFYKGYIYATIGKNYNEEAINNFLNCITLDKTNYSALYNLGIVLLKKENFEESKSYFIKAYKIKKKFYKALLRIGDVTFKEGKYDIAMQYYETVIKYDTNNESALIKKSDLLLRKNNIEEALKLYEKVLELNEINEEALLGKGICKYKMNKIDDSIKYFDKALQINKENEVAIFNKAIALFNKGEKKLLKNIIKKLKNNKNLEFFFAKGLIFFFEKEYNLAIENFDECLKKSKIKLDILYQKGLSFYENKKYDLAIKCFNQALKEKSDSPNILNSKAMVLEKQGNKKESLELYKKASESKPYNSLYLLNYCLALFENNNFEKCKDILTQLELLYKNQNQKDLLGEELIKYIQNSIEKIYFKLNENKAYKPNKPKNKTEEPIGLYNVNLNCYMNSVIQCLFHMSEFSDYFIDNNFSQDEQPISSELKNIFIKLKNRNKGKPFELNKFKELMGEYDDSFLGSNGADAADLLSYIFSSLSAEFYDDNIINNGNEILDESNENEVFKETLRISNQKCINNILYFYNKSTYLCKNNHINYSFESGIILEFNILDINEKITHKNKILLKDCFINNKKNLNNYEFYCSKCQKDSIGNLKTNLYMTKDYLIIMLNYGKNKNLKLKVIYDEYINIEEFVEKKNNEYFKLIGAIFHYGDSSPSGHYVSYCRNKNNNKFYNFNDSKVKLSNFENILKDNFA